MQTNEIQFNQYEGGYWIATYQNVILWVEPDQVDIQFYEVPEMEDGYTFSDHVAHSDIEIKIAQNEDGVPIAFFMSGDKAFALLFNSPEQSQWMSPPHIDTGTSTAE